MQTQLELAGNLGYLDQQLVKGLMDQGGEVARLINGLVSAMARGKVGESATTKSMSARNAASSANSADEGFDQ
jgi:hypothetical protein